MRRPVINGQLHLVEYGVLNRLTENGWKIIITDSDLRERFYPLMKKGVVLGSTAPKEKRIYVHNDPYCINLALLHEVGHTIDQTMDISQQKSFFAGLYKTEFDSFYEHSGSVGNSSFLIFSPLEYFACAFHDFHTEPETLKASAPATFRCIEMVLQAVSNKKKDGMHNVMPL